MLLSLTSFAEPRIVDDAGSVLSFPAKAVFALVYMALEKRERISRSELAEFLWDVEKVDAAANLRQLLARVKSRALLTGQTLLQTDSGDVVGALRILNFDFERLPIVDHRGDVSTLRRHLHIQKGVFLAGMDVSSEKSTQWLEHKRDRFLSNFACVLDATLNNVNGPADFGLLAEAGARLLEMDAYSDVAVRALLKAHAAAGRHGQAQALFRRHVEKLRSELGIPPEAETVALAEMLYPRKVAAVPVGKLQKSQSVTIVNDSDSNILPRLLLLPPLGVEGDLGDLTLAFLEDITIGLCRARSVSVVAPHTASRLAAIVEGRDQAFARHNVAYALDTRLRTDSVAPTLFGGLVDVSRDRYVWAETFDVSPGKLARSYKDIIKILVSTINRTVEDAELLKIGETEPSAYQHYLLGQYHLRKIDLPELRRARRMFKQALQYEPRFANALGGLARAEHLEWLVTARGDRDMLLSAETHAQKAIDADPGSPSGYHQLGVVRLYNSAFDDSVEALEEAVGIAPSHADLIADYADTLVHASEPEKALEKIQHAIDLNPICPDVYWWTAAGANYALERFETSLDCIGKMSDKSTTGRLSAACWGMLGDTKKARAHMRSTMKIYPDFSIEKWLSIMPVKEDWQKEQYREGLKRAGFR